MTVMRRDGWEEDEGWRQALGLIGWGGVGASG